MYTINDAPAAWNLLWSRRANCFHVEPAADTVKSGMRFFLGDKANDYLVIFSGTADEVCAKADSLRHVVTEREEVRRLFGAE